VTEEGATTAADDFRDHGVLYRQHLYAIYIRLHAEIDGKPVVAATSSFRINCCQLICSSCLWHFMWKASRALILIWAALYMQYTI